MFQIGYVYTNQGSGWVETARLRGAAKAELFYDNSVAIQQHPGGTGHYAIIKADEGTYPLGEREPYLTYGPYVPPGATLADGVPDSEWIVQGFVNYFDDISTLPVSASHTPYLHFQYLFNYFSHFNTSLLFTRHLTIKLSWSALTVIIPSM